MLQLRHLQQHVPQYDSGQEVSENQLLAALRLSPRWNIYVSSSRY
ncbi:Putative inner membrane protein [Salmonella enterica subsp. enterica]|uniref:Inner membrane protein n=1 Tax=Salmonella enterica I TaxID=59201 RepID=A0A379VJ23_SALET|nr:Putative inner membrane protein [Salmonella enterica subsp. enterica]